MGKITSEDVKPILEKFKRLTGNKPNKITSSDVTGPMKKKNDLPEEEQGGEKENNDNSESGNAKEPAAPKSSGSGALVVGKKIAKAFREEILLSSSVNNNDKDPILEEEKEEVNDYSTFRIPKNTHAIAIDDSKIQRKLLGKLFSFAGIPPDRCTIVGDGYDEVMVRSYKHLSLR